MMDVQVPGVMDEQVKCLICESGSKDNLQCLNRGIQSSLEQCEALGRVDLVDFIQSNKSKPLYLHKSCRQKWLKFVSKMKKKASMELVGRERCTRKNSIKLDFTTVFFLV